MIYTMEQNSAEWFGIRAGRITASRIVDVMTFLKNGEESQKRIDYRADLVAERLTGMCEDNFKSKEMQWGTDQEPFARARYEMLTDLSVETVGFITHPEMDFTGGSPDGLVGNDGLIELKCPKTTTHIAWKRAGIIPEKHVDQCMWNIACAEREWCDFASFDPRVPQVHARMFRKRLYRDDARIKQLEEIIATFNDQVEYELAEFLMPEQPEAPPTPTPLTLEDLLRESLALVPVVAEPVKGRKREVAQ